MAMLEVQGMGHTIIPPRPALVPITTSAAWVKELSGLTLPDVTLVVRPRPGTAPQTPTEDGVATPVRKGKKGKARQADAVRRGLIADDSLWTVGIRCP
ncbi:MAG: NAD(P)/FAD-dependent oxidoreductase [Pirellulales bacterium]